MGYCYDLTDQHIFFLLLFFALCAKEMSKAGAVSLLRQSCNTPPKREREGFFFFNFIVTLAFTLLDCLFCLWKYSPISVESRYVLYRPFLGDFCQTENRPEYSHRLSIQIYFFSNCRHCNAVSMGSGRASNNMLSSSFVTLTCAAIVRDNHTSNKKKYEVRTSLYGLNKIKPVLQCSFAFIQPIQTSPDFMFLLIRGLFVPTNRCTSEPANQSKHLWSFDAWWL